MFGEMGKDAGPLVPFERCCGECYDSKVVPAKCEDMRGDDWDADAVIDWCNVRHDMYKARKGDTMNEKKCCICKRPLEKRYTPEGVLYWDDGNNAWPIQDGRCCDKCNSEYVIPARMGKKVVIERK
jgi:hypothetical protein